MTKCKVVGDILTTRGTPRYEIIKTLNSFNQPFHITRGGSITAFKSSRIFEDEDGELHCKRSANIPDDWLINLHIIRIVI
jgi:hypothetical protein